jgi:hypothetical protein
MCDSGRQASGGPQQRHYLLPRDLLCRLRHMLPYAMPPTSQDVGSDRHGGGPMHQHHRLVLQYVELPLPEDLAITHIATATSSINILIDVWIIVLPISTILKVQRPKREKAALVGIFCLGAFSCFASIVRLHSIRIYTESKDPFFDSVPINLWSMVEVNIGIYCASIPACKALFSSAQHQRSKTDASYQYHSRGRSGKMVSSEPDSDTIVRNEAYELRDVERPKNWLASDSELEQVTVPASRV